MDHVLETVVLVHQEVVLHIHGRVEWEMLEWAGEGQRRHLMMMMRLSVHRHSVVSNLGLCNDWSLGDSAVLPKTLLGHVGVSSVDRDGAHISSSLGDNNVEFVKCSLGGFNNLDSASFFLSSGLVDLFFGFLSVEMKNGFR